MIEQSNQANSSPAQCITLLVSVLVSASCGSVFNGLAEDGTWFRHADGSNWWAGGAAGFFEPGLPWELQKDWADRTAQLLFPMLLAISFMHCKNVQLREVSPPEALTRKRRKKPLRLNPCVGYLTDTALLVLTRFAMRYIFAGGTLRPSALSLFCSDGTRAPTGGRLRCEARASKGSLRKTIGSMRRSTSVEHIERLRR
jgi:hypothetical protein